MPRTASWLDRFSDLEAIPDDWIDRATVERVLQVSPRRAQQIMENLPGKRLGSSHLVSRAALLERLRAFAVGQAPEFEIARRQRMADWIEEQARERIAQPQLLVEAKTTVINTRLADLPEGVTIQSGRITVDETDGKRALEKLLALCMAIGNDFDKFDQVLSGQ